MKVLIIDGHPRAGSLCHSLAEKYAAGAKESGAQVVLVHLRELNFDSNADPSTVENLELDLQFLQREIKSAEHIAWVFPAWWGGMPALLKGFLDRTFNPGFAFKYDGKSSIPVPLLKGRTSRILVTMDAPKLLHVLFIRHITRPLAHSTLRLCGIKNRKIIQFNKVRAADERTIQGWLVKAEKTGFEDGKTAFNSTLKKLSKREIH